MKMELKMKSKILIGLCIALFSYANLSAQKGAQVEARPEGGFSKKISGVWDCGDFGNLTLKQNGNSVTGTYEYNGGSLKGNIVGNKFSGIWSESETGDSGAFEFELQIKRMTPDPTHLEGRWNHANDKKWQSGWNCVK
ncbi:hypothetical protein P3G55_01490 [Leptospira sp. 96542]|nr:hypothetical protein [Leptospira sp. 96542]